MKCLKRKIIMVPYPAQGHVTPMLKVGEAMFSNGFNSDLVIILPKSIHYRVAAQVDATTLIIPVEDGREEGAPPPDFFAIEKAMEDEMPNQLRRILHDVKEEYGNGTNAGVLLIVDLLASWAIEVGNECGVQVAGFWPAMLATYHLIASIPDMVRSGLISESGLPEDPESVCYLPCESSIKATELPWMIGNAASIKSRFKFWTRTLERSRKLKHLLVNSFPDEYCKQHDVEKDERISKKTPQVQENYPMIYHVGPLSKMDQINKNPSFWEEDMSCLEWLHKQKDLSVIYVSFGSWVSSIGEAKLKKLAMGLVESGYPVLWVLGPSWRQGLSSTLLTRVSKLGKLVSWAPQVKVLKHKAVGCYLTHCGWNSTMEAIQCRKRLLCYPVAGDQFVNCAYIVDVWKIGVRIDGVGRNMSLTEGVKMVMEDSEMASRLKTLSAKTVGGTASARILDNLKGFQNDTSMLCKDITICATKFVHHNK